MLGAAARYGISVWLPTRPGHIPWGTFWTNLSGSFVLGLLVMLMAQRFPPSRYLRPFVATGFLGAFTTMSTFEVEAALLLRDGHIPAGLGYLAGSLLGGVCLAYAGMVTARRLTTGRTG